MANKELTLKDIFDLVQAGDLAESMLNEEERAILHEINETKDEQEKHLGRRLNDEEAETIERSISGGWDVVVKLGELQHGVYKEVRQKGERLQ